MRIAPLFVLPLVMLAGSTAVGQPGSNGHQVQLSNFKFSPNTIVLDHGRPYVLRLVNVSGGGHDFTAPSFFAVANVTPADRRWVVEGEVEVPPGQPREIRLTAPVAGRYKLKCTHTFHKMLGMSGAIIVR